MATYLEIDGLSSDSDLLARLTTAVLVSADAIRANGTATAQQRQWAVATLNRPQAMAQRILPLVLVQNRAFTAAQIRGATDASLQTAVDTAVPMIIAVDFP